MKETVCAQKKKATEARKSKPKPEAREPLPTVPPVQDLEGLVCWWCVHGLPQRPCIHLPVKYDEKLNRFTTIGNFCSWQCAKAYALDMNSSKSGEIQSFLSMMRLRAFGKFVPLWPAPKRQFLKCFGGTMSIEEFRGYGGLVEPPQLYFPIEKQVHPILNDSKHETSVRGTTATTTGGGGGDKSRLMAIENSTGQAETLKLKRTKPLARAASKLESTLGITRKPQRGAGDGTPGAGA
jgi:hypothetical protein